MNCTAQMAESAHPWMFFIELIGMMLICTFFLLLSTELIIYRINAPTRRKKILEHRRKSQKDAK
jgi:uncharacterized membrane protein YedE/YeeE